MVWLHENLHMTDNEIFGLGIIIAAFLLVCLIGILKSKAAFLVRAFVRMISGIACIILINQILSYYHFDIIVGINLISFLTCAILGIPGAFLLLSLVFI